MQVNNYRHPGKTTERHTATNYLVQDQNAGKLEDALAEFVEAVTDAVEGMAKRKAAAKEGES